MKIHSILIALITLIVPGFVHATSYTCDAHKIVGSELEATGQATIDVDAVSASWQGSDGSTSILLSSASICGMSIGGINCQVSSMSQSETPGNLIVCRDSNWNVVATGDVVTSEVTYTGRVECETENNRTIVEISNCK